MDNPFIAHVTQMPDLVRATRELTNDRRQFVVRVSEDQHSCHVEPSRDISNLFFKGEIVRDSSTSLGMTNAGTE